MQTRTSLDEKKNYVEYSMTTISAEELDTTPQVVLPPLVINNPRQRIEAQQISLTQLVHKPKGSHRHLAHHASAAQLEQPLPRFPLELSCSPTLLCFKLDEDTVVQNIRMWNVCKRSIYVLCCGLWDETARLGASWYCSPRTRFLLPPGFAAKMEIKAIPRGNAPISYATTALQVAVGHKRDNVVGYIVIPVCVKFLNYVPPCFGEGG